MDKYIRRKKRRHTVLVNIFAYTLAYLTALLLRYGTMNAVWQMQFYATIYIIILLIAGVLHFYRISTKKYRYVEDLDPIETLSYVIRSQVLLYCALLGFLVVTQQAQKISRIFLALFFIFNILYIYLFRMLYRHRILRKEAGAPIDRAVDIITLQQHKDLMTVALRRSLPARIAIHQVYCWEERDTWLPDLKAQLPVKEAYIYLPGLSRKKERQFVLLLQEKGFSVQLILSCFGTILTRDMAGRDSSFMTVHLDALLEKCDVLGIHYTVSSPEKSAFYVKEHLPQLAGQYVCFSNVHTTVMANEDPAYLKIQNGAALTFPDGAPIASQQNKKGYSNAKRVAGPDFMDAMFRLTDHSDIRHYFYGSTQETLDLLKENLEKRYPRIQIAGMYSPPFRELTTEEDKEIVQMLQNAHADIYWIGLGAPRQEVWMARHQNQLPGVMMGVGAGFNFYAGNIRRAPAWVQKAGLEWLYRLFQDPKRLMRRYVITNAKFFWYLLTRK